MDNIISKLIYTALSFTLIISVFSIIGVNVQAQLKSPNSTAFLSHSPGDLLSLNLNLKRIETQLDILLNKINTPDRSFMFEHAYIIHSTIFPSALNFTNALNKEKSQQLEESLLFGSVEECIQKINAFYEAGVKRIHFWPINDYEEQIEIFKKDIASNY